VDVEIEEPEIDQLPLHRDISLGTSWPLLVTARFLSGRQIHLHNLKGGVEDIKCAVLCASIDVLKLI
jgi:hypothetical protein